MIEIPFHYPFSTFSMFCLLDFIRLSRLMHSISVKEGSWTTIPSNRFRLLHGRKAGNVVRLLTTQRLPQIHWPNTIASLPWTIQKELFLGALS
jgi:hypothetical protein